MSFDLDKIEEIMLSRLTEPSRPAPSRFRFEQVGDRLLMHITKIEQREGTYGKYLVVYGVDLKTNEETSFIANRELERFITLNNISEGDYIYVILDRIEQFRRQDGSIAKVKRFKCSYLKRQEAERLIGTHVHHSGSTGDEHFNTASKVVSTMNTQRHDGGEPQIYQASYVQTPETLADASATATAVNVSQTQIPNRIRGILDALGEAIDLQGSMTYDSLIERLKRLNITLSIEDIKNYLNQSKPGKFIWDDVNRVVRAV